jgi:hypothetical protein
MAWSACSGYFVGALLDLLDAYGHGYLIKVKLKNLGALLTRQQWTAIAGQPGWDSVPLIIVVVIGKRLDAL